MEGWRRAGRGKQAAPVPVTSHLSRPFKRASSSTVRIIGSQIWRDILLLASAIYLWDADFSSSSVWTPTGR
jgi:hypothetical protein